MTKLAADVDGKLIIKGGKLCTSCCACRSQYCVDFGILFPEKFLEPPFPGTYATWTYPGCDFNQGYGGVGFVSYDTTITNPLAVSANLVACTPCYFNDDVIVDETSWGITHGEPCPGVVSIPANTVIIANVPPGGSVRLRVVDTYLAGTAGYGIACWVRV